MNETARERQQRECDASFRRAQAQYEDMEPPCSPDEHCDDCGDVLEELRDPDGRPFMACRSCDCCTRCSAIVDSCDLARVIEGHDVDDGSEDAERLCSKCYEAADDAGELRSAPWPKDTGVNRWTS